MVAQAGLFNQLSTLFLEISGAHQFLGLGVGRQAQLQAAQGRVVFLEVVGQVPTQVQVVQALPVLLFLNGNGGINASTYLPKPTC